MEASKPVSAKQLKEHLQHQQEPFSLHSYLSERRFLFKNFSSDSSSIDNLYSAETLKQSIKYEEHKTRRRFLHARGFLRSLLHKVIPNAGDNQEFSNWVGEHKRYLSLHGIAAASGHYSDKDVEGKVLPYEHHSSTLVNMFQAFTVPKLRRLEVDAGTKPHWISTKEKQQHSTESEWKEPLPNAVYHFRSHEAPVTAISTLSQKSVRDPLFSNYLRKLLVNTHILKLRRAKKDKLQEIVGTASLCHRNKRTLQKRQKLLFGCVEKARGFHQNKGKRVPIKAVSEHFGWLEKKSEEVKKLAHLLHTESCIRADEWRNFHELDRDIHMEIGNAIMDEIVKEMLDLFLN